MKSIHVGGRSMSSIRTKSFCSQHSMTKVFNDKNGHVDNINFVNLCNNLALLSDFTKKYRAILEFSF
jgi:hypothetical protein